MEENYAEGTDPVCTAPSVIELGAGSASWRPVNETRPYIMRLGSKHEALLSALLCGLDRSSRINRFGHAASNARVRSYAKEAVARAAYMAGAFDAGRLIGVVEAFAISDRVVEVAFAVDADWRRRGLGLALLEAATRWGSCTKARRSLGI